MVSHHHHTLDKRQKESERERERGGGRNCTGHYFGPCVCVCVCVCVCNDPYACSHCLLVSLDFVLTVSSNGIAEQELVQIALLLRTIICTYNIASYSLQCYCNEYCMFQPQCLYAFQFRGQGLSVQAYNLAWRLMNITGYFVVAVDHHGFIARLSCLNLAEIVQYQWIIYVD